ncbi:glycosyl transferase family 2 [Psychroflexus planctonicus]|uniref:Glycosyl transferase family 2 n=1 Tax=Psychroflexus planctonicus TaxID=1526575 RepID=A0ABQ1SMP5_9FLAO|nr:glycosyl transferase family 2 [Psychroflexus planctonicus]
MNFLAVLEWIFFTASSLYFIYLLSFLKLLFYNSTNSTPSTKDSQFVSVLICAKNEAKNLQLHLPIILKQNHPHFEVVVVNDQSSDNTLQVLESFQKNYAHLKVFTTTEKSSKKKALALAKKKAQGSVYVLTDADCLVNSTTWLTIMVSEIQKESQVVLGYAPHFTKSYFLNKLQRFETLTTALQYFTAALYNAPYMGVGRNLAYTKQLDKEIKFSKAEKKLLSGDDDLWIQKAKQLTQIKIQLAKHSFAYSHAEPSLKSWWKQKSRHISTAAHYQFKDQFILSGIFITKFAFWMSFIAMTFLSNSESFWMVFSMLCVILLLIYKLASTKLNEAKLWYLSPILDFSLICFQFCLFISNLVSPFRKWK